MSELALRSMIGAEMDAVVALWRRSRQAASPWLEARVPRTVAEDRARLEQVLATGSVWVAIEHDAPIGFLALAGDDVDQLFVDPPAQGRGIGTALLEHAKAARPDGLRLFTHQRNRQARAFYERRGFVASRFGTSPPPENEPDALYEWRPLHGRPGKA